MLTVMAVTIIGWNALFHHVTYYRSQGEREKRGIAESRGLLDEPLGPFPAYIEFPLMFRTKTLESLEEEINGTQYWSRYSQFSYQHLMSGPFMA